MKIYKVKNYDELSRKAANIIAAQITLKPDSVLGLATGSSPVGLYKNLVSMYEKGDLDFSQITTVNLDEYKGLDGTNDQSYRYFMNENLLTKVNVPMERTFVPDGTIEDAAAACAAYDEILNSVGTVDIQLLGLGHDGHLGFNEPDDHFEDGTHCVQLTETTIQANKRFFEKEEDVPRQAYTMGIGGIMRAKMLLVVASGEDKADILNKVLTAPVSPQIPGTILRFHPNVILVADEAALSKTELA